MNPEMHDLAPAYALGSLDSDERREFEAHLVECRDCRELVTAMKEVSVELAWAIATDAPEHLRPSVMAAVDATPQDAARQEAAPAAPVIEMVQRTRSRWIPTSIAAAVVALALIGWSLLGSGRVLSSILDDPASISTEATATEAGEGVFASARVVYSAEREASVIVIEGLSPVGEDRVYELWLIGDSGPAPAGLFTPDADGRATVLLEGDVRPGILVALTQEPAGGVDAPTGDVLLTAEVGA
jgi:anti-sigma-K factor RskA